MRLLLAVSLAAGTLLAGCAPVVPVPVDVEHWAEAPKAPRPGDLVRVRTRKGAMHVFRVSRTEEKAFYGIASDNMEYRVPYAALASVEVRRKDTDWVFMRPHALQPW